jgi:hypothetical protein
MEFCFNQIDFFTLFPLASPPRAGTRGGLGVVEEYDFLPEQYFVVYGAK